MKSAIQPWIETSHRSPGLPRVPTLALETLASISRTVMPLPPFPPGHLAWKHPAPPQDEFQREIELKQARPCWPCLARDQNGECKALLLPGIVHLIPQQDTTHFRCFYAVRKVDVTAARIQWGRNECHCSMCTYGRRHRGILLTVYLPTPVLNWLLSGVCSGLILTGKFYSDTWLRHVPSRIFSHLEEFASCAIIRAERVLRGPGQPFQ